MTTKRVVAELLLDKHCQSFEGFSQLAAKVPIKADTSGSLALYGRIMTSQFIARNTMNCPARARLLMINF